MGILHCSIVEALIPINALGNIPNVGLHPTYRANLSMTSHQFPITEGVCKQGIRHRNTGAMVLLARLQGAEGIQELLRDESQLCVHFLAVFVGSCGCAAVHRGGVSIPETSPSSELDDFEIGNLVLIKFCETGPSVWPKKLYPLPHLHIFCSECGICMLKIRGLVKTSAYLCLG